MQGIKAQGSGRRNGLRRAARGKSTGLRVLRSLLKRHIAYNTSPIIHDTLSCGLAPFGRGLAGHASRAGLAGRVSCSSSAVCVVRALTDYC